MSKCIPCPSMQGARRVEATAGVSVVMCMHPSATSRSPGYTTSIQQHLAFSCLRSYYPMTHVCRCYRKLDLTTIRNCCPICMSRQRHMGKQHQQQQHHQPPQHHQHQQKSNHREVTSKQPAVKPAPGGLLASAINAHGHCILQ